MTALSYPEIAERFYKHGIGLKEFLSLVDFLPNFGLTNEDVNAHESISNQHRLSLYGHITEAIADTDKKIATAKDGPEKKNLLGQKEGLLKQLEKAQALIPIIEYDGSKFYKFFRILDAEAKKVTPLPGEKPEVHHQRVINHLAGIIPGMVTIKKV